jgi:hypothetical protein
VAQTSQDFDDFLIVEDIDLSDESELRRVHARVESLVGNSGRGLRLSVLSAEQWQTMIMRTLPTSMRRGAERHIHSLRDRKDPQHLLVSPSAVRGINERSRVMYQEIVYALLRALPSGVKGPLRKGADDLVAEICGAELGVDLFVRNYPRESQLVRHLAAILITQFHYTERDWVLLLRRDPDRFFLALRRTNFTAYWLREIQSDERLGRELARHGSNAKEALMVMIRDEALSEKHPFFIATERAAAGYLAQLEQATS